MRRRLPWILLGALLLTLSAAAFLLATDPGLNSLISIVSRLSGGRLPEIEVVVGYLLQSLRGGRFLLCFDDFHHVDEDADLNLLLERLRAELAGKN